MNEVWFRCDRKNLRLFQLNSFKKLNHVPNVGDTIVFYKDDFMKISFRMKFFLNQSESFVCLRFKVISREYNHNSWELICEPVLEDVLNRLINVKTK